LKVSYILGAAFLLASCATITKHKNEEIMFTSAPNGATVQTSLGDNCTTPCIVHVKSKVPFKATVSWQGASAQISVDTKVLRGGGWALAGNIIVAGGPLGLLVDVATGAALEHERKSYHVSFSGGYLNQFN
jgi:hypothetical protein